MALEPLPGARLGVGAMLNGPRRMPTTSPDANHRIETRTPVMFCRASGQAGQPQGHTGQEVQPSKRQIVTIRIRRIWTTTGNEANAIYYDIN